MLKALAAVADGRALRDAEPSGVDAGTFLDELKALQTLRMVAPADQARPDYYTLTADGEALTSLLGDLATAITRRATGDSAAS